MQTTPVAKARPEPFQTTPVPRIARLSKERFEEEFLGPRRPVVITGAMDDWPALERWTDDYLLSVIGDAEVELAIRRTDTFADVEKGVLYRRRVRLGDHAARLLDPRAPAKAYLMNEPMVGKFAPLFGDVRRPVYVPQRMVKTSRTWTHMWIGPAGTITPAHYDGAHNVFTQVRGRKRVVLFDPSQYERLYPCGIESTMPHNSRIGDVEHADVSRFPRFRGTPAHEAVLGPGEMLFIPTFWWHQVRAITASISVNFWWRPPPHTFASRPGLHVLSSFWYRGVREFSRRFVNRRASPSPDPIKGLRGR